MGVGPPQVQIQTLAHLLNQVAPGSEAQFQVLKDQTWAQHREPIVREILADFRLQLDQLWLDAQLRQAGFGQEPPAGTA